MNNSAQHKDPELRMVVLFFVNYTRNAFFISIGMCCFCFFFYNTLGLGQNPLKICKTVRNEEPAVRPWERQWNRVTHGETVRVERSVRCGNIGVLCVEKWFLIQCNEYWGFLMTSIHSIAAMYAHI